MSSQRARWLAAGVLVFALAVVGFVIGMNPANLPESWIERWLEQKLPPGSSIVAVRNAIDEEGWTTVDEGVSDTGSIVLVHIGNGWLPRRHVVVYFTFDEFGRLVSVDVQKRAQLGQ
jgi:hypothetical protein